LGWWR